jgi:hypothetical protein
LWASREIPEKPKQAKNCGGVSGGVEQRGSNETAKRSLGVISQVLDYAVAIGHCTINPAHSLKRHVPVKLTTSHYPCIPWSELPELLAAMRANTIGADASTLHAMVLLGLTFVSQPQTAPDQPSPLNSPVRVSSRSHSGLRREDLPAGVAATTAQVPALGAGVAGAA